MTAEERLTVILTYVYVRGLLNKLVGSYHKIVLNQSIQIHNNMYVTDPVYLI